MVTVILQHDVQNYDSWKVGFDAHQAERKAAGVLSHTVGQLAGSPNTVVMISQWENLEKFQAFMANPSLAEAMQKSGVVGKPTVQVVERTAVATY